MKPMDSKPKPFVDEAESSSSSGNSTTPPSETTLADDNFVPPRRLAGQTYQLNIHSQHQSNTENPPFDVQLDSTTQEVVPQLSNLSAKIYTDYESSAAEESDLYTLSKYESAECALLSYSRTNKLDKLQALLEAKAKNQISLNLNFRGQQKQNFSWSALHLASYFGHIEVVELLLSRKQFREEIDINIQNHFGDTALHKCALTNRQKIVQLLLSNKANVFIKNCDGLFAKDLTQDKHILDMLEAAEQADKNQIKQNMFKAVDNGDLRKLQEYFNDYINSSVSQSLGEQAITIHGDEMATTSGVIDTKDSNDSMNNEKINSSTTKTNLPSTYISQMTDERGNSLLHIAAMRGFQAICIYLLEQGFDPYRRNNLNQTCIDICSYQLRQLFMSVKPANSRLKQLSKERVSRLEGPLMKKVRILGWRQTYVVLENGVILLFNNRRDYMNKTRKGYKYLESAQCEPDPNDLGVFTILFSDRSRATFMVSAEHINQYPTYRSTSSSNQQQQHECSIAQIELVRQKWLDSIRDHISYSTQFIRKGLRMDEYDDDRLTAGVEPGDDLSSLNHLLPVDTIKSFFQEARAHYSIMERHSESLCNLVQSLDSANSLNVPNSLETSVQYCSQQRKSESDNTQQSIGTAAGGSRLFGLIGRGSANRAGTTARPNDNGLCSNTGDTTIQTQTSQNNLNSSHTLGGIGRKSITGEFLQDTWPCVLFHLRLLIESTQNTKTTMGQALALMEHQESLRQHRLQDQEERCRVLEDSLHSLARDHHELEKSMSQVHLAVGAGGCRSMSMSTDLNEYYDAFEDFDDDKTMTPDSTPSYEDLDRQIKEVMYENEATADGSIHERKDRQRKPRLIIPPVSNVGDQTHNDDTDYTEDDEELDDDDLRSNCSALTVETVTEQFLSAADTGLKVDHTTKILGNNRTRLPAPMLPRSQISLWSILKNCIGKDLSKITMPVVLNEPLTMLQRAGEGIQYTRYLKMADASDDPVERMELVCAFIIASISPNCHRIIKPFNPLLYETFEYEHKLDDGSSVRGIAQQVSHHPPITAVCCESEDFVYNGIINPKIKFWGRSIEVTHDGSMRIHLIKHNETYLFNAVACSVHNILTIDKLWFEHHGPLDIKCYETNLQANLNFKQAGWFGTDVHRFEGFIVTGVDSGGVGSTTNGKAYDKRKLKFVYGKWSDYIKTVNNSDYENFLKQQKLFKIPDDPGQCADAKNSLVQSMQSMTVTNSPNSVGTTTNNNSISANEDRHNECELQSSSYKSNNNKKSSFLKGGDKKSASGGYGKSEDATRITDIPNSKTLWRLEVHYMKEYYNFSLFTMKLNELTPELEKNIPKTDSRFRPDVRKLEEGDLEAAASEKERLEEKQRDARAKDKRFKDPSSDFLWFEQSSVPNTKEKFWLYKGGYWENKCKPDIFPDLF